MKLTTKNYVKQQVCKYLHAQHPEMSQSRIERIAAQHSAHPLTVGYNDEDPAVDVDMDAVVRAYYHILCLLGTKDDSFERTITPTLRELKEAV